MLAREGRAAPAKQRNALSLQSLTAFHRAVAMHLVQILLPRADNTGRPFGREHFDRVKEDLASCFEGVTAYLQAPAEGQWQDREQSSQDDIVIFEVMVEEIDLPDWRRRRAELERRFRQDTVIIRYMPMELV
ncbi:hypothetical protein [Allomesorhizobium alhagi]|jgi:hypothetical protein|uniref:Uncharacterized protein n=1 Tax=Mesorhizobium alhagi CCNWXJ12-2 TaxID=1107882 RepID=H0I0N5_9HYPH|nr:hypothetical protein [Mesorhizobium alhagi]EHK53460.1 hypothetical protein MAXJ12_30112 [Mesorhizobium alhagi CCNWXJ12-2]